MGRGARRSGPATGLVVHSGGPSVTLNASLVGVIERWRELFPGAGLFGARYGPEGLLAGDWIDLGALLVERVEAVRRAPGSAIGTSRRAVGFNDAERAIELLAERGVDCLFYTGGNGSMGAAHRLAQAAAEGHRELRVVGIPNTVDNDVAGTDHTPGFASAARFYASAVRDVGEDNRALPSPITVVEVIGRNVGWVTAATALARESAGGAPHLIYVPERPPESAEITEAARDSVGRRGRCVIAVCEGLRDRQGEPFGADLDRAGDRHHELARNLADTLARRIAAETGLRARAERPGLVGRSFSMAVSEIDLEEPAMVGRAAVDAAAEGQTGVMVGLRREPGKVYRCGVESVGLDEVAGIERTMPREWAPFGDEEIAPAFEEYLRPLVGKIEIFEAWTDDSV